MANKFRNGDRVCTSLGSISDVVGATVLYSLADGSIWNEHCLKLVRHTLNDNELFRAMCSTVDASPLQLKSTTRQHTITWQRQAMMYVLRRKYEWPLDKIGQLFNRDHSTVIHACHKVEDMLFTKDKEMTELVNKLMEEKQR